MQENQEASTGNGVNSSIHDVNGHADQKSGLFPRILGYIVIYPALLLLFDRISHQLAGVFASNSGVACFALLIGYYLNSKGKREKVGLGQHLFIFGSFMLIATAMKLIFIFFGLVTSPTNQGLLLVADTLLGWAVFYLAASPVTQNATQGVQADQSPYKAR